MSRSTISWSGRRSRFPRVSGDEPLGLMIEVDEMTFSPRERG